MDDRAVLFDVCSDSRGFGFGRGESNGQREDEQGFHWRSFVLAGLRIDEGFDSIFLNFVLAADERLKTKPDGDERHDERASETN